MIKPLKTLFTLSFVGISILLTSCCETEDPGPLQEAEKEFSILDFDRLEIGDAFTIKVEQASVFRIKVEGDRRNIDDLDVYKSGSTLVIKYDDDSGRKHNTFITITMPTLKAVNFSGASVSTITGFESDEALDLYLSGASISQLVAGYREVNLVVSGASNLVMRGLGDELHAEVSGASVLNAFEFPVRQAEVSATGASMGKVTVTDDLDAMASGASSILYRGNPSVSSNISGGSSIQKD
jgi:Putative auto-transporter adhesin, head GIN domain